MMRSEERIVFGVIRGRCAECKQPILENKKSSVAGRKKLYCDDCIRKHNKEYDNSMKQYYRGSKVVYGLSTIINEVDRLEKALLEEKK